jgi:hypothetical protein
MKCSERQILMFEQYVDHCQFSAGKNSKGIADAEHLTAKGDSKKINSYLNAGPDK